MIIIGLLTNLPPDDVTRQAKTPFPETVRHFRRSFQTALTLKGNYHHFDNSTVLFQPHGVEII